MKPFPSKNLLTHVFPFLHVIQDSPKRAYNFGANFKWLRTSNPFISKDRTPFHSTFTTLQIFLTLPNIFENIPIEKSFDEKMAALRWHQRQHGVVRHVLTAPTRRVSLREATSKRVSCNADSSLPIAFDSSFRRSFYLITAQLSPRWPKHAVNYVSHQKPTFFDRFVEIFVEDFCTSKDKRPLKP